MRKPYKLKKPTLGIDQLSDETSLISNDQKRITSIRKAVNVDIDSDGNVNRRKGYIQKLAGLGYHSLYENSKNILFLCSKNEVGVYDPSTNIFTSLAAMAESYLTSFAELNGNTYFMNPGAMGMFRPGNLEVATLGVSLPDTIPSFEAMASGSLKAGKYGVAYSVIDSYGEESPLGPLTTVELTEQGSVLATALTPALGFKYRIYMTTTDGDELSQAAEFDADVTSFLILDHDIGRRPATQFLSRLPFGYILRAHGSRLYVATEGFIHFSDAFMPHLRNEAHNFLPTQGYPTMLQPVEGGVFVGDDIGVTFYTGDDPTEFVPKTVSTDKPIFGTAIAVPGSFLPEKYASKDVSAIWLTRSGYHIGLPTGEIVRLHAERVSLPQYTQGCTALSIKDGRKQIITPVNSNLLANASVALDSIIS